jgi:fructose-1,6-bisphosphatase/inositol monophosphatase family enzyme
MEQRAHHSTTPLLHYSMANLIDDVKQIVTTAGKRALERCGTVDCEFKSDQSLVTAVDRDTERFVEAELAKLAPGYAFVGEEYGWRGPADAPVWACDPIDGTTNFVYGLPHWCVSVGLLHEGVPLLGAIYLPVLDELFWAVKGEGAFCNGVRLQATDRDALHVEDTICLTSNSLKTLNPEAVNGRLRLLGSIATELAYTARGNLCATVGLKEGIVDVAAALCICFEAGCRFEYLAGGAVDIDALLHARRTDRHFVYAPPRLLKHLRSILHPR